jgi:ribosomal protein S18 acetylase RimI-like enzyme
MDVHVAIHRIGGDEVTVLMEGLIDLLLDCVQGGASVSFMAPVSRQSAARFWQGVADSVARNERILIAAQTEDGRIAGIVQIITAQPPNQPHRADVAKLLVHRAFRRQGIGRKLMEMVDSAALAEQKSVLVLDTETGGDAERLYERAGWTRVGTIPNYALKPHGGLCATTFFYKQL